MPGESQNFLRIEMVLLRFIKDPDIQDGITVSIFGFFRSQIDNPGRRQLPLNNLFCHGHSFSPARLGPVDTHRPAITPATRSMRAGTPTTVPPARIAIPRNAPHSRRRSRSGAAGPPGPGQAPHHGPSLPGRNDGPDPPRVRIGGRGIGIEGPARNAGPAARTVRRRIRAPSLMTEWGHGPHRGGW